MTMTLLLTLLQFMQASPVEIPKVQFQEEIVPGFILSDIIEINGVAINRGDSKDQAMAALGPQVKLDRKPKKYRAKKLASEMDLISRLAPSMYFDGLPLSDLVVRDCGDQCFIQRLQLKISEKIQASVVLHGQSPDAMKVGFVIIDNDRSMVRRWYQREMSTMGKELYYDTPDGAWRVSRIGKVVRLESIDKTIRH